EARETKIMADGKSETQFIASVGGQVEDAINIETTKTCIHHGDYPVREVCSPEYMGLETVLELLRLAPVRAALPAFFESLCKLQKTQSLAGDFRKWLSRL